MKAIVAVDEAWGIGKDGKLLTHLPEDMKNRINIVLTSDDTMNGEGLIVYRSVDDALKQLKEYDSDDVYIIGGQSIYEQFLPYCDTAYVTRMKRDFGADTWFVNLDSQEGWEETETGEEKEYEGLHFAFCTYKNRNCPNR